MDVYVVERFLVGWSTEEVEGLLGRLAAAEAALAERGVHYVESIVIPGDETCLSVFEGPDVEAVRSANDDLALPTGRVLAATTQGARA